MASSKKREKQMIDEDAETANEITQFAEIVSQSVLERDASQCESFEFYAHQLRTHLHADPEIFKTRFSEGYRILIEELEKDPII